MLRAGVMPDQIHENVCPRSCSMLLACMFFSSLPLTVSEHIWLNPNCFSGLNEKEVKMRLWNKFSADKDELIAFFWQRELGMCLGRNTSERFPVICLGCFSQVLFFPTFLLLWLFSEPSFFPLEDQDSGFQRKEGPSDSILVFFHPFLILWTSQVSLPHR